jgi:fucose permease
VTSSPDHRRTLRACYTGLFVQATVNNLAPLLFIVFHTQFSIPLAQLGALAALNFGVQLLTDLVAIFVVDRVGYRAPMVLAHAFAALGLVLLAVLPGLLGSPFLGLAIAVAIYGVGGGLLEVLVSPVVEHLPTPAEGKSTAMALLHSFYCWGQLTVVVGTTILLAVLGSEHWTWLPVLWAIIPLVNLVVFVRVPMPATIAHEDLTGAGTLFGAPLFLGALVLMMTGGAAELTMVQWSSFFAETGLGVGKEMGDLLGPGLFALLMGLGRFGFGIWGSRLDLKKVLLVSGTGAAVCYAVAALSPAPVLSLLACSLCGLMVALLWPGTISLTSARFPGGGAAMFAVLALAGDGGGTVGPALAGLLADATQGPLAGLAAMLPADGGSGLRTALLLCGIVPAVFAVTVWRVGRAEPARNGGPGGSGVSGGSAAAAA